MCRICSHLYAWNYSASHSFVHYSPKVDSSIITGHIVQFFHSLYYHLFKKFTASHTHLSPRDITTMLLSYHYIECWAI